MKILHLIDSGGLYGAEMMLISLCVEQERLGLNIVVGSIRKNGIDEKPFEKEAKKRGIKLKIFEMKPGLNLLGAFGILRYAKNNCYDIIHSHGYKTNILLGFIPSCIRDIPMVSTLHGWTSTTGWTKMRLNESLDALSLRFVDKVVLVNKGMLSNARVRRLPRRKVCIVNNGIEIDELDSSSISEQDNGIIQRISQFCSKGRIIASVGRLSKEKGYNYLIDAVSIMRKEYGEDVRLLLIGAGRLHDQLEYQAQQSGMAGAFFISGYINNARNLLKYVDCYVISSLTEGLPITLLEVMASETPLVATAVGGIPHVISDNKDALLIPPQDPYAMATAIHEVLNSRKLSEKMTSSSRKKIINRYSSKVMAKKYRRVYINLQINH